MRVGKQRGGDRKSAVVDEVRGLCHVDGMRGGAGVAGVLGWQQGFSAAERC